MNNGDGANALRLGIYVHIPFCVQKCCYCDFPSYPNLQPVYADYIAAVRREISDQGGRLAGAAADSIFIGGGTPTALPVELLQTILDCLRENFCIDAGAEITVEANPGTVDGLMLKRLRAGGVNRISFGVQSFADPLLRRIGRIHTAAQAVEAVYLAAAAGFAHMNVDLLYGLPEQTPAAVADSLRRAAALPVDHISVYGLKVEPHTPFAAEQAAGLLALPDEESEECMYDMVCAWLPQNGFDRYEISNYARAGARCRHNLKYWRYQPYLGVGAGAYSFIDGIRRGNTADVTAYLQAVAQGQSPVVFSETPAVSTAMAEFIFLALRTVNGLEVARFDAAFQCDFFRCYEALLRDLTARNLLQAKAGRVFLTALGMKYGNRVFAAFLPERQ